MKGNRFYQYCMELGKVTGCHQMPERSFFVHGKQFPVCARCTGVFIGELTGIALFRWGEISVALSCVFLMIMLIDWGIQYLTHRESTNFRRLISGLLCGYAFGNFIMKFIRFGVGALINLYHIF